MKPGIWIDPDRFVKQIADAGYAARRDDIRFTLTGKLSRDSDRLILTMDDVKPGPQAFLLQTATSKDEKERKALADTFSGLDALVGKQVEIAGLWKPADDKKNRGTTSALLVRSATIEPPRK